MYAGTFLSTVWYEWTAPTNGVLYLSGRTDQPGFILSIRVYRGSAVDALVPAPTTPGGGVPVIAGDTVAIQVGSIAYPFGSSSGGTGPFTLSLRLEPPVPTSPNDRFADRLLITPPFCEFEGSINEATAEPNEPLPLGTSQTLWWRFVPPEEGVLSLKISAAGFEPVLRVYEGASLASLSRVSPLKAHWYRLRAGQEYAVQMASGPVPGGFFALTARFFTLTNDFFPVAPEWRALSLLTLATWRQPRWSPVNPTRALRTPFRSHGQRHRADARV